MADKPLSDDTQVVILAHPGKVASPGRQLLDRVVSGCALDKILRQLNKRDHQRGGFRHRTSGFAAAILGVLCDRRTRKDFLRIPCVRPENFRNDEECARALALGWMISDLARAYDAEFNKRFPQFCRERHKAQTLHGLGPGYEDDTRRHVYMGIAHLSEARSAFVRTAVPFTGRCIERDFGGLRAPLLVAELVSQAVALRRAITERRARYLCGW